MGGGLKTNQGEVNTILLDVTYKKLIGGTPSNPTYTYQVFATVTLPSTSNDPNINNNLTMAFITDQNKSQPGHQDGENHNEFLYSYNDGIPDAQAPNPPTGDWKKYTLKTYTTSALTSELGEVLVNFKSTVNGKKVRVKGIAVPPNR